MAHLGRMARSQGLNPLCGSCHLISRPSGNGHGEAAQLATMLPFRRG